MKFTATVEIADDVIERFRSTYKERQQTSDALEALRVLGDDKVTLKQWADAHRAAEKAYHAWRNAQNDLRHACASAEGSVFQQLDAVMEEQPQADIDRDTFVIGDKNKVQTP